MKIEDRKPRANRFDSGNAEARLARLRDEAPTLGNSRKLRVYALFGAALMVLTVAAFYLAMQIYRAANEDREEAFLMQVEQAPEVVEKEVEKAVRRIEEEEAEAQSTYQQQVEALKEIDLLEGGSP